MIWEMQIIRTGRPFVVDGTHHGGPLIPRQTHPTLSARAPCHARPQRLRDSAAAALLNQHQPQSDLSPAPHRPHTLPRPITRINDRQSAGRQHPIPRAKWPRFQPAQEGPSYQPAPTGVPQTARKRLDRPASGFKATSPRQRIVAREPLPAPVLLSCKAPEEATN